MALGDVRIREQVAEREGTTFVDDHNQTLREFPVDSGFELQLYHTTRIPGCHRGCHPSHGDGKPTYKSRHDPALHPEWHTHIPWCHIVNQEVHVLLRHLSLLGVAHSRVVPIAILPPRVEDECQTGGSHLNST